MNPLAKAQETATRFIRDNSLRIVVAIVPRDGEPSLIGSPGVDISTPFPICSTTKIVTAMTLCSLAEQGTVKLDDPIGRLVSEAPEFARQATLRQLLSHRAGFSDADGEVCPEAHELGTYVAAALPGRRPVAEPGQVFWYSNVGFDLAALVAERATGVSFPELARDRVLGPLGMSLSHFDDGPEVASGGLLCTIGDLAKLMRAILGGGGLMRQSTIQDMSSIHGDAITYPFRYYGLGIGIEYWRGRKLLQHGGFRPGFGSYFLAALSEGCGVASLFEPPVGFGLHPYEILDPFLPGEGLERPPDDAPVQSLVDGEFRSGGGQRLAVRFQPDRMIVTRQGRRIEFQQVSVRIYRSLDGQIHAGVMGAPSGKEAEFIMWNEDPIGFVSVTPFRRVQAVP